jgi:EmrB/QacA subfamily drug resistance transporter
MFLVPLSKVHFSYKWLVTVAVTLGLFMSVLDSTIVNVAIPQMQRAFGADFHNVQWVITIYMLTQAAVIPIAPYLTAKFGGKRAYVWTLSAFLLGSLLCGFAWNLPSLLLFRLIQGIGGGILLPMAMTLLYQAFSPEERGMATSVMGVPLMIAPVLGPVLGGFLVSSFGWPWAFFINVPLGIVAVVIAQRELRQTTPQLRTHFDVAGFLTAAAGSVTLVYAVSALTSGNVTIENVLLLLGATLLLLAFVMIEQRQTRRGQEPLLDVRHFKDRAFAFSLLALVFFSFVWFGLLFLIPIYLQTLHQETALQAGAIQGTLALATIAILPMAGRLSDKIGPRLIAVLGLIVLAGATALMLTLTLTTAIWIIVGIMLLLGCASGLTQQIPVSAMSRIEKEDYKAVVHGSTLVTVLRALAAPLGVATISGIVQVQSEQNASSLATQGITGKLLQQQGILLGMHQGFLVIALLALTALVVMCFVPKRRKNM